MIARSIAAACALTLLIGGCFQQHRPRTVVIRNNSTDWIRVASSGGERLVPANSFLVLSLRPWHEAMQIRREPPPPAPFESDDWPPEGPIPSYMSRHADETEYPIGTTPTRR